MDHFAICVSSLHRSHAALCSIAILVDALPERAWLGFELFGGFKIFPQIFFLESQFIYLGRKMYSFPDITTPQGNKCL